MLRSRRVLRASQHLAPLGPRRSHLFAQMHFIQNRKALPKYKIHSECFAHRFILDQKSGNRNQSDDELGSKNHRILLTSRYWEFGNGHIYVNQISVVKMVIRGSIKIHRPIWDFGVQRICGPERHSGSHELGRPQQIKRSFQRVSFGRI